ncbi:hypothetical protein BKA70DRAFT_1576236 [Coprinopsis sp. MPI-PUGE-AT-0042]|nr:hypothetical protein BKA70DRAFT_1576236 [Coprinopsis sp. MPI-PUGE-AT-0042]
MTELPFEILDAIVDSAAEIFSISDRYGTILSPELVSLLKNVALVSRHLSNHSQRYLFQNITLNPFQGVRRDETRYMPPTMDEYISMFKANPRFLNYTRSFTIKLCISAETRALPPHFLSEALPFFAQNLRCLRNIFLYSSLQQYWSGLPDIPQQSLAGCIAENALTSFKVIGLELPREFSGLLPSSVDAFFAVSYVELDPTFVEKYLATRKVVKPPRPTHIRITSPSVGGLDGSMAFVYSLDQTFYDRCLHLDFGTCNPTDLFNILSRVRHTLKTLTLRHLGYPNEALRNHHQELAEKSSESRFPSMPCLEQLHVMVAGNRWKTFKTCPEEMASIVADYCTASFASVKLIQLDLQWALSLARVPGAPLFEREEDGFAFLDDLLANSEMFAGLNVVILNVVLELPPMLLPPGAHYQMLSNQLQKDGKEVFFKTAQRVKRFDVIWDDKPFTS